MSYYSVYSIYFAAFANCYKRVHQQVAKIYYNVYKILKNQKPLHIAALMTTSLLTPVWRMACTTAAMDSEYSVTVEMPRAPPRQEITASAPSIMGARLFSSNTLARKTWIEAHINRYYKRYILTLY